MTTHHLEIKDLTVAYQRVPAVHHVSLDLHCGHCIALLGPNGAGKTTFFKALVGLVPKETGEVIFGGHGKIGADKDIAYFPQRSVIDWDFPVTVRGMVEMGRYMRIGNWGRFGKADHEAVDLALAHGPGRFGRATNQRSLRWATTARISRAVARARRARFFARRTIHRPRQDRAGFAWPGDSQACAAGNLVIASHHDLKSVPELFDQVIFLNGELIAFGDTREVFNEENIARTYRTHIFSGGHAHDTALARST